MPMQAVRTPAYYRHEAERKAAAEKQAKLIKLIHRHIQLLWLCAKCCSCAPALASRMLGLRSRIAVSNRSSHRRGTAEYRLQYFPTNPEADTENTHNTNTTRLDVWALLTKIEHLARQASGRIQRTILAETQSTRAILADLAATAQEQEQEQENTSPTPPTSPAQSPAFRAGRVLFATSMRHTSTNTSPNKRALTPAKPKLAATSQPVQPIAVGHQSPQISAESQLTTPLHITEQSESSPENSMESIDLSPSHETPEKSPQPAQSSPLKERSRSQQNTPKAPNQFSKWAKRAWQQLRGHTQRTEQVYPASSITPIQPETGSTSPGLM